MTFVKAFDNNHVEITRCNFKSLNSESPLWCPLPGGDNTWLLPPHTSDRRWSTSIDWTLFFLPIFQGLFWVKRMWDKGSCRRLSHRPDSVSRFVPRLPHVHSSHLHTIKNKSLRSWYIGAILCPAGDKIDVTGSMWITGAVDNYGPLDDTSVTWRTFVVKLPQKVFAQF